MDSSGYGSGNHTGTRSSHWNTFVSAPESTAEHVSSPIAERMDTWTTTNTGDSPSHGQRPASKVQRNPLFSHPRSVSLPQALHSLSLSNRSGFQKFSRSNGHSLMDVEEDSTAGTVDSTTPPKNRYEEHHHSSNNMVASTSSETRNSVDASSPVKRAISEGHNGPLIIGSRQLGRSETNPRLAEILYTGDTQLLDPLPKAGSTAVHHHRPHHHHYPAYNTKHSNYYEFKEKLSTLDSLYDHERFEIGQPGSSSLCEDLIDRPLKATERALSNPDILRLIFESLDAQTVIPHELVQQRRKPLSLRHAQLIFGDNKQAVEAWEKSQPTTTTASSGAGLFNCLFVNSQWHDVAVKILEDRIHFCQNDHWTQFARRGVSIMSRKPRMLVLHKLNEATQVELDMIDRYHLGENLEWLEFYTCAGIAPSPSLLGPQLTRIILPGCYRVNDRTLAHIAAKCPQLEHLDVRACEQVSDRGIKMIAKYCPALQLLNVGRTRGGDQITYKGIKHLARQTQISTLGIAGCHIDDRAIWELALNRGPSLQRLSLNNCKLLTDASVPRVLGYMPNLSVLEIRGCSQITHMRPIALFKAYREKQGQPPLIEGCEVIERRLQVAVMRLQRETSHRILSDLSVWINQEENETH